MVVQEFVEGLAQLDRVDFLFAAHDHNYERWESPTSGLKGFVSGGGGAGLYSQDDPGAAYSRFFYRGYHYLLVEVAGGLVRVCPKTAAGTLVEPCTEIDNPEPDGGDPDGGEPDGGIDGGFDDGDVDIQDDGVDTGPDEDDAGPADEMPDAQDAGADTGPDAGEDAGVDAGVDAGADTGADMGPDAGPDAGTDTGPDAGFDAGTDAGDDAGEAADGDPEDGGASSGCGCHTGQGSPPLFLMALLILLAVPSRWGSTRRG
jgi:MYXO-CTERM domain-containing protein